MVHVLKTSNQWVNNSSDQLLIYPNPASDRAIVTLSEELSDVDISIFDLDGKIIYKGYERKSDQLVIDVAFWKTGIYIIEIKTGKNRLNGKLLVIN